MRVGVDIGGTKTDAVVLGPSGSIAHSLRLETGWGDDAVLGTAVAAVTGLADLAGIPAAAFESIGVGIPGTVRVGTGVVEHALNLGVQRLDLGQLLADRFRSPVWVENDVNAAAVGAFFELGFAANSSMAYLNLGTGLASGLVLGGQLWRGSRGAAGEIGHILLDPAGPVDQGGERGGLEVVASGSGIARQWAAGASVGSLRAGGGTLGGGQLGGSQAVTAMLAAADAGDPYAADVRRRLFEGVAAAVRILILTLDVDTVVVGGGITALGDRLVDEVRTVIERWESTSPFIRSLELGDRMRLLPAGSSAAAVGAARLGETG